MVSISAHAVVTTQVRIVTNMIGRSTGISSSDSKCGSTNDRGSAACRGLGTGRGSRREQSVAGRPMRDGRLGPPTLLLGNQTSSVLAQQCDGAMLRRVGAVDRTQQLLRPVLVLLVLLRVQCAGAKLVQKPRVCIHRSDAAVVNALAQSAQNATKQIARLCTPRRANRAASVAGECPRNARTVSQQRQQQQQL